GSLQGKCGVAEKGLQWSPLHETERTAKAGRREEHNNGFPRASHTRFMVPMHDWRSWGLSISRRDRLPSRSASTLLSGTRTKDDDEETRAKDALLGLAG